MRFLFICAHPDDLEFNISNLMITIAQVPSHITKILCMTKGEYGTLNDSLKGEKLGKIRQKELLQAAKMEGIQDVEFLNFLDAHVEINGDTIQTIREAIEAFKPDVIFAPEGLYSYYPHDDHLNTGIIVYNIIKGIKPIERPILYTYHSYINTHYFPMRNLRLQNRALLTHKSQYWLLIPTWLLRFFLGFYFFLRLPRKFHRFLFAEAYRKVNFENDQIRYLTFKQRIIARLTTKLKKLFKSMED
ncbi:MAG: PIG-L deacetylase family protein [Candidatus Helarchaeota archaeon]